MPRAPRLPRPRKPSLRKPPASQPIDSKHLPPEHVARRLLQPISIPSADEVVDEVLGGDTEAPVELGRRRGGARATRGRKWKHLVAGEGDEHAERLLALQARSREPFLQLLAALLEAQPSMAAMKQWARAAPDKWVAAIVNLARICGFMEKEQAVPGGDISALSDQELRALAAEFAGRVAARLSQEGPPRLLDVPPAHQPVAAMHQQIPTEEIKKDIDAENEDDV